MAARSEETRVAELDEAFKRHGEYAKIAKKDYDAIYERLVNKLSALHLEPLAKILFENEKIELDTESSIRSIQENLRKHLVHPWDIAWKEHIADNVTKLEMLKEHFKQFEGIDWKVNEKTVDERIQPMRIEFKLKRKHWLQKQIDLQNQQIEKLKTETVQNRLLLQQTVDESIMLTERLKSIDIEAKKAELINDFNEVNSFQI